MSNLSSQEYFSSPAAVGDYDLLKDTGKAQRIAIDSVAFIKDVAVRALENHEVVLGHWLPDGEYQGAEYVALNPKRQDSELGSFKINTTKGVWCDFADFDGRGGDFVSLISYLEEEQSQLAAAKLIEVVLDKAIGDSLAVAPRRHKTAKTVPENSWTSIVPVPPNAVPPPQEHFSLGKPSKIYTYFDSSGLVLCHVYRFEVPGGKEFRPLTYGLYKDGALRWGWKGLEAPRPLFGLFELAKRPNASVLICEGEKASEAAQTLFPDHVCVTSLNGSQSPEKADWSPLKGKQVFIWPDNDQAGKNYATKVAHCLIAQDPKALVKIMQPIAVTPGRKSDGTPVLELGFQVPRGWDAADAVHAGWTQSHIELLGPNLFQVFNSMEGKKDAKEDSKATAIEECGILIATVFHGKLIYSNDTFYGYSKGCWSVMDLIVDVQKPMLSYYGKHAKLAWVNAAIEYIKILTAERSVTQSNGANLICLSNGTLDPLAGELLEHKPEHRLTNRLDIQWNPTAHCPRWLQFLDEVFALDIDRLQRISFLQEWFGYCLIPDSSQHKFLWMVGAGGNGKSVVLDILAALVGYENVSHAYIERLDNKFVRAELEGKLLNISSEMSAEATIADGYLKAIVAGDLLEAERKFKTPFSFRPYVRLVGATNELPRLLDVSDGFFRRAVLLTFTRQFSEMEQDKALKEKLLLELPGILRWAVDGLLRLKHRGQFEIPQSSHAAANRYRTESDTVKLFFDETLIVDRQGSGLKPAEIYEKYVNWCRNNGFQPMNNVRLGKRLHALGIEARESGGTKYWRVDFKDQWESGCVVSVPSLPAKKYLV